MCAIYHLHRSEVYAISRNMKEEDSEKKSQLFPKGEIPSISDQLLQSAEGSSRPGSWKVRKPLTLCTADRQGTDSSSEGMGIPDTGVVTNEITNTGIVRFNRGLVFPKSSLRPSAFMT